MVDTFSIVNIFGESLKQWLLPSAIIIVLLIVLLIVKAIQKRNAEKNLDMIRK
ncbi:hypothetical protein J4429_04660 [Candidatus Pacearchaeota archaeon]|nr:hypothetical protein [Candidatus Pacearchaeota archaeon]